MWPAENQRDRNRNRNRYGSGEASLAQRHLSAPRM